MIRNAKGQWHDPATPEERLWSKVQRSGGCWLWTGYLSKGYGRINLSGKNVSAHRLSYELVNGAIPQGMCVLHRCDVRNCVRPDHLFLGSQLDNVHDRDAKDRQARGPEMCANRNTIRGERVHTAKLTEDGVRWLREWGAEGWPPRLLALAAGCTKKSVYDALSRKSWAYVSAAATPK